MNILTIILISLTSIATIITGWFGIKLVKLNNRYEDLIIKNQLLELYVQKQPEPSPIEGTEGFLRFISESRDWAFEYIEDVQSKLGKFVIEVDPLIQYFDKYGDTLGMTPNYEGMKKISHEFKQLKELLPKNDGSQ